MVVRFEVRWCRVSGSGDDLTVEAPVVEPVDVGECGELDVGKASPTPLRKDQLSLMEPFERLQSRTVRVDGARFRAA